MKVTLISGRTAKQGIGLEEGKFSEQYSESVNNIEISPTDGKKLSLKKGENVKVSTDFGSVIVKWTPNDTLESGLVFFPYGPWANQVYSTSTGSTGMPIMKGLEASIEACDEKVLTLYELVEQIRSES
jgi:formylmethanofuran dehydrogenase subunit D